MESIDLYTYCVLEETGNNKVVLINSNELMNWKLLYKKDFIDSAYIDYFEQPIDIRRFYFDPDASYKRNYNNHFFCQLTLFLNKRESQLSSKLQGKFQYKFVQDSGIKVWGTDKDGKSISPFVLRSDQLGFSSPSNEKSHPYDLYIMKSENKCDAIEKVIEWITISRTIGGSFLWPMPFYRKYNPARGGKITSSRRYYIQDRVDLTLWEIKYWYENANKNTIMSRMNEEDSNLNIWLSHFSNFQIYVEFFCFKDFVSSIGEGMKPLDILTGEINEPQWESNGKNPEIKITNKLDITEVERMLTFVNNRILQRSKSIAELLGGNFLDG